MKTEKEQNKFRAAVSQAVEKRIQQGGEMTILFYDIPGFEGNLDLSVDAARRMHKELNKLFGTP